MTILGFTLLGISALLWAASILNLLTLHRSDPAGNALSQAFGSLMLIGLWLLLGVVTLIAALKGQMPGWAKFAALPLLLLSGAAAVATVEALRLQQGAGSWIVLSPAINGLLLLGYGAVQLWPNWRARFAPDALAAVVWGSILLLSLLPWPTLIIAKRERASARTHSVAAAAPSNSQPDK